jgi:peptide-methionine (R)-S-oxide reductase
LKNKKEEKVIKMKRNLFVIMLLFLFFVLIAASCKNMHSNTYANEGIKTDSDSTDFPVRKSEAEWKKILTASQFYILREKGTELPFTGKYLDNHEKGVYKCAGCGQVLFSSDAKFESGTGWPSFWEPFSQSSVVLVEDHSLGMTRIEVLCSKCGGHLGHVFDDGPAPTYKRYCINSDVLIFQKSDNK